MSPPPFSHDALDAVAQGNSEVTVALLHRPDRLLRKIGVSGRKARRAEVYLDACGLMPAFLSGDPAALAPDPCDLAFLHKTVRRKRPRVVVELGCGNSTIALASALAENYREDYARYGSAAMPGHVYAVDTSPQWIANTRRKLSPQIAPFVDLRHSEAEVVVIDGGLCHAFRELPNVCPDLIFVDGPQSQDVRGVKHGLGFITETGWPRPQVASDPLLYESTLPKGALILVDGRKCNTLLLRRMLKRRYRFRWNASPGMHRFELRDG